MKCHPDVFRLSKRLNLYAFIPGVIASIVYLCTLSRGIVPGTSATLTAAAVGLISLPGTAHPLFALIARSIASLDIFTLPTRMSLFSALCATLCAILFYRLVARFILFSACEGEKRSSLVCDRSAMTDDELSPEVIRHNQRTFWIAVAGGVAASFFLILAAPTWSAATQLDTGFFDLLLALSSFSFFPLPMAKGHIPRLAASAFFFSLGLFESVAFLFLTPVFGFFLFCRWVATLRRARLLLGLLLAALSSSALMVAAYFQNIDGSRTTTLARLGHCVQQLPFQLYHEARIFFPAIGWFLPLLQIGLIALIVLAGRTILFRSKAQGTAPTTLLILVALIPGLLGLPFSPQSVCDSLYQLPVFAYAIIALGAGVVLAASLLVLEPDDAAGETRSGTPWPSLKKNIATLVICLVLVLVFVTPLRSYQKVRANRGEFVDHTVQELLDTYAGHDWIFSNGLLDVPLRIRAFMRKTPITLVSLRRQDADRERESLQSRIATDPLFAACNRTRLQNALSISCARFATEWFNLDTNAAARAVVLAAPDLWTACGYRAVPDGLAFRGVPKDHKLNLNELIESHQRAMKRIAPLLADHPTLSSKTLVWMRETLRIRMGYVANELGVLLEELGDYEAARNTYADALAIDAQNLSAALNLYAVSVTRKTHLESHDRLQAQVKRLLANNRTSDLMTLLQRYGTIRIPAFYRQQAALWNALGKPAVATDSIKKAMALSKSIGVAALNERASCLEQLGDTAQAETCYRTAWEQDATNHDALIGLCRLALGKRNIDEADRWMKAITAAGVVPDEQRRLAIDLALLKHDPLRAQNLLKEAIAAHPEDASYWSRLADVLVKQEDALEVETVLLPEMRKNLSPADLYLPDAIQGALLCKKGPQFLRKGRLFLLKSLARNAAQPKVWHTLLTNDMGIGDLAFIESDARTLLSQDPDHVLANYLMGSVLLSKKQLDSAEDFLRRSVVHQPTAMACNDLAEVLRMKKNAKEAEPFARQALDLDPKLTVALDTLACIFYDLGKNDEALRWSTQAVAKEPRCSAFQITLLRILIKQGDPKIVKQRLTETDRLNIEIPNQLRREATAFTDSLSAAALRSASARASIGGQPPGSHPSP